jgi:hypothetical protein
MPEFGERPVINGFSIALHHVVVERLSCILDQNVGLTISYRVFRKTATEWSSRYWSVLYATSL